ncbi:hypothetical protein GV819_21645 [Pseudomonas sp. Fl5BN2]|uniref:hypothetical protein n=1 Tax=Pseudomonas sp. Fl5BN2 TaxID=2697652 RepID=UPI001378AD0E|nr:hypothetical protein [Pseudomonas sp. Fl5BN2]NBF04893.1 hypothetical protein [Pseudomonas sp. Fl5BN2]
MGGAVWVSKNMPRPEGYQYLGGVVNGSAWDAFGELLDAALLPEYFGVHSQVKSEEGLFLRYYSFDELSRSDFNLVVRVVMGFIFNMLDPSPWQLKGKAVWDEVVGPCIKSDPRYEL